jgi:hypothetical protein
MKKFEIKKEETEKWTKTIKEKFQELEKDFSEIESTNTNNNWKLNQTVEKIQLFEKSVPNFKIKKFCTKLIFNLQNIEPNDISKIWNTEIYEHQKKIEDNLKESKSIFKIIDKDSSFFNHEIFFMQIQPPFAFVSPRDFIIMEGSKLVKNDVTGLESFLVCSTDLEEFPGLELNKKNVRGFNHLNGFKFEAMVDSKTNKKYIQVCFFIFFYFFNFFIFFLFF